MWWSLSTTRITSRTGTIAPVIGSGISLVNVADGPLNEVHAQLRAARVFVAPAKYEPFGLAILEAAQEFCALVLGDIPTLRELWGGAAIFVPPDEPEAIRATVQELMSMPGRAANLGARAHVRARRYTARAMGQAYMDLYAQLSPVDMPATAG